MAADRDFAQLQTTARPPKGVGVPRLRVGLLVLAIVAIVIAGFVGGFEMGRRQGHETAQNEARKELVAQIQAQQKELQLLRQQQSEDQAKAKAEANALPSGDVGDLTFYADLPKQPVKPEPLSQPVSKPTMAAAPAPQSAPQSVSQPDKKPAAAAPASPAAKAAPSQPAAAAPQGSQMVHAVIQRELAGQAPAPAAKGAYYVQVASFRDTQEAGRVQHRLTAIGLDSRLKRAAIPGRGVWYRLQAGPYASRHDAEAVRVDIAQKLHMKALLVHDGRP